MNKQEIWKSVVGYEELYEVSNFGRVKGLQRKCKLSENHKADFRIVPEKIIKQDINAGYCYVGLFRNGKCQRKRVHRLVAEAFLLNQNNLPQVNHKDENKLNNHIENLEWCTGSYNIKYGTCRERIVKHTNFHSPEKLKQYAKRRKKILQLLFDGTLINTYESLTIASLATKLSIGNISSCCHKKRETAGGYRWKFKEVLL
jgi:hypothetical protein